MSETFREAIMRQIDNECIEVPWITDFTFEDLLYVFTAEKIKLDYRYKKEINVIYDSNGKFEMYIDTNLPNLDLIILFVTHYDTSGHGGLKIYDKNTMKIYNISKDVINNWRDFVTSRKLYYKNFIVTFLMISNIHVFPEILQNIDPSDAILEYRKYYLSSMNIKSARKV